MFRRFFGNGDASRGEQADAERSEKRRKPQPFEEWLARDEILICVASEGGRDSKTLLLTDHRLVLLIRSGKIITDAEEVLWKNFLGVRQYQGGRVSRLDLSIKTSSGDIATWRFEGVKKQSAAIAYSHLKKHEITEKEKPPKQPPKPQDQKPPRMNFQLEFDSRDEKKNDAPPSPQEK